MSSRAGLFFTNILLLFPLYAMLIVTSVLASKVALRTKKLSDQNAEIQTVQKFLNKISWTLWVLSIGGLVFSFTFGIFIIPLLVVIPYFYGGLMILVAIAYLVISGYLFYSANVLRKSKDYQDGSEDATTAVKYAAISGGLMLLTALIMIIYSIWSISKYSASGGLSGDVKLATQLVAPEGDLLAALAGQASIPVVAAGEEAPPVFKAQELARAREIYKALQAQKK